MKILFVCTANIHRSALAGTILRALAKGAGRDDIEIASAGVLALDGEPAAPGARRVARSEGFDLSRHRSRALTVSMLREADLIVVMERSHADRLSRLEPGATDRCRLLSGYAPRGSGIEAGTDVPDAGPDEGAGFEASFAIVKRCVEGLWRSLPPPPEEVYTRSIEERFRQYRRQPMALSPVDWEVIERWWKAGVPLWLVLSVLDGAVSGRRPGSGGRARRLSYFEADVEERFEAYRKGRVSHGDRDDTTERPRRSDEGVPSCRTAERRLEEAAARAARAGHAWAAAILDDARREARALEAEPDPTALIRSLDAIEQRVLGRLRDAMDPGDLARLRSEAAERLASHRDRMSPEAFESTVTRLVDTRVREIVDLPSLTLP